jgi:cbb3-type cytochrome oxidase subunit 3
MTSTTGFRTHRHLARDLFLVAFTTLVVAGFLAHAWSPAPRGPVETAAVVALR